MSTGTVPFPEPDPVALLAEIPPPGTSPEDTPAPRKGRRPTTRAGREEARQRRAAERAAAEQERPPRLPVAPKPNVKRAAAALHEVAGQVVLPMVGLPATGAQLASNADAAGEAWAALARRYPALERLFVGGGDAMLFVNLAMTYVPVYLSAQAELAQPREQRAAAQHAAAATFLSAFGVTPPTPAPEP